MFFWWHWDVPTNHCVVEFRHWSVEISHRHACYIGTIGDNLNREVSSFQFELWCSKSSPEHIPPSSILPLLHCTAFYKKHRSLIHKNETGTSVFLLIACKLGGCFWVASLFPLHAHTLPLLHHYRQATCRRRLDPLSCTAVRSLLLLSVSDETGHQFFRHLAVLGYWQWCSSRVRGLVLNYTSTDRTEQECKEIDVLCWAGRWREERNWSLWGEVQPTLFTWNTLCRRWWSLPL